MKRILMMFLALSILAAPNEARAKAFICDLSDGTKTQEQEQALKLDIYKTSSMSGRDDDYAVPTDRFDFAPDVYTVILSKKNKESEFTPLFAYIGVNGESAKKTGIIPAANTDGHDAFSLPTLSNGGEFKVYVKDGRKWVSDASGKNCH